ncbi:MAG: type II toxin-antitoxin system HipA family toxin [Hyphomicrobiales bacterium]|nr:type II toxin-antitoxin system HipA family toxin [Hyphomicrobiales bacterium]
MSKTVPVWFDALHVGDVIVGGDGTLGFAYTEAWLKTRNAFPLSMNLPLETTVYRHEVISPWLANLLPEGEQFSFLAFCLRISRADTLMFLNEIGGDTAGALSFGVLSDRAVWAYTPLTEFYRIDDPQAALEKHFEDLLQRPFLVGEDGVRLSLAGAQRKSVLAVLDSNGAPVLRLPGDGDILAIPRHGAPSTVILKPDNPALPGIVENETYCLRLAQAIGITSAEAVVLSAGSRNAICALRYDRRIGGNSEIQRVHQEDFAQANGMPPERKYERGVLAGPDLATLLGTGRHLPSADALSLLDQLIFNILVANTDAHAKNYSLLLPVGAGPRLAPLYDVLTALPWPVVTQYFAQNVAGRKRKPGDIAARHWDAIAKAAGCGPADVRKRVKELVHGIVAKRALVTETVAALPGSAGDYVREAAALIEKNALRIAGRL